MIDNGIATVMRYEHTSGYSCKVYGSSIDAYPPDDIQKFSSVYQCWRFDWIERNYQCHNCNNSTTLYWHPKVHKYYDYATLQEIKSKIDKDSLGTSTRTYLQRMKGYQVCRLVTSDYEVGDLFRS